MQCAGCPLVFRSLEVKANLSINATIKRTATTAATKAAEVSPTCVRLAEETRSEIARRSPEIGVVQHILNIY
jgi:hypothetical protein